MWVFVGWHLDGISFDRFRTLTWSERGAVMDSLLDLVDQQPHPDDDEPSGPAIRGKRLRK